LFQLPVQVATSKVACSLYALRHAIDKKTRRSYFWSAAADRGGTRVVRVPRFNLAGEETSTHNLETTLSFDI